MNRSAALIVATMILTAGQAFGQNALGDGQTLDRNLRQGSGGRNTRVRDLQAEMRFQNAIVTGSAPGGKSLQTSVGYRAPEDFVGSSGSDDLFAFRRDSAFSGAVALGYTGTDALRYQFGLSTGSGVPHDLQLPVSVRRTATTTTGTTIASVTRSTSQFTATQAISPTVLAYEKRADGGQTTYAASPLLGVKQFTLESANGNAGPESPYPFSGIESIPRGMERPEAAMARETPKNPDLMDTAATTQQAERQENKVYQDVLSRFQQEYEQGSKPKEGPRPAGANPTPGGQGADQGATPEGGAGAAKPALSPAEEWRERLNEMRLSLGGKARTTKPEKQDGSAEGTAAKPRLIPGDLTPEEIERQERQKKAARDAILGIGIDPLNPATVEAVKKSKAVIKSYQGDGVQANLAYSQYLVEGQKAIGDGKYFDAEDRFSRALSMIPGDPMAQAGRVHAQIGSGLYLSGAANLRTMIAGNPEMTAAKYEPRLLPSAERWGQIQTQLRSRSTADDPAVRSAAGLLLAYMGYQYDDAKAVAEGLGTLERASADAGTQDTNFLTLVKEVWMNTGQPAAPQK